MTNDSAPNNTLVFPAIHPDGVTYIENAKLRSESVVAASSEWNSDFFNEFGKLEILPYIYHEDFPAVFSEFLKTRRIVRIYCPVVAVYTWIEKFLSNNNINAILLGVSPIKKEMASFDKYINKANIYQEFIKYCANGHCSLTNLEIASIFKMTENVYGESNIHKIAAIIGIFSNAPKGDVIEIGSLVGKSASLLAFLAKRLKIGNALSVDPWSSSSATQVDSPEMVRTHLVDEWDYRILPQIFIFNMLPIGFGHFNYIRKESEFGYTIYSQEKAIQSPEFGTTLYSKFISVIHIDGNHDYSKVKLDCDLWLPHLGKDSWLILDDYIWAHGDGPYIAGNDLLMKYKSIISNSFVCGKALFIKFSQSINN